MKTNEELQRDVQDAIKWEPLLNAAEIGVTAQDGIVTLSGKVDSFAKKAEAEEAAKNVSGVKAVVENIEIVFNSEDSKTDAEIAKEILNAFVWNWAIPNDLVKVQVENGWVTLSGTVRWNYQREAVKRTVNYLIGVNGVTNNVMIKSEMFDEIERKDIERALLRNWATDNRNIEVLVTGNRVTLKGTVYSVYQKEQASRIAWNAPGVWAVENELNIELTQ